VEMLGRARVIRRMMTRWTLHEMIVLQELGRAYNEQISHLEAEVPILE